MNVESNLGHLVSMRITQLHEIAPGSIGDLMAYEMLDCSEDGKRLWMRCQTFEWMRNGPGTLHGGMCATVVDQAMGFVAYCIKPGEGSAPTVQMQVEYHRPLVPGEDVLVCVHVISATKNLMHLRAEAFSASDPAKVCLTSSATYFYKPAEN